MLILYIVYGNDLILVQLKKIFSAAFLMCKAVLQSPVFYNYTHLFPMWYSHWCIVFLYNVCEM